MKHQLSIFFSLGLLAVVSLTVAIPCLAQENIRKIAPEQIPNYGFDTEVERSRPPVVPATREKPFGECQPEGRMWSFCLNRLVDLMDRTVEAQVAYIGSRLMLRADVPEGKRTLWVSNLNRGQAMWRALKEQECGILSTAEQSRLKAYYEVRAGCQLNQILTRMEDLDRRFPP